MIGPQNIHDALNLLSDDLIAPVEALRQKKPIPWKMFTALAASVCLCVGLWYFFPVAATENAAGGTPENGSGLTGKVEHSFSLSLTGDLLVCEVGKDYITVVPLMDSAVADSTAVQDTAITVTLESLESVPELKPGQHIRIYFDKANDNAVSVSPNRIEIIKEEIK